MVYFVALILLYILAKKHFQSLLEKSECKPSSRPKHFAICVTIWCGLSLLFSIICSYLFNLGQIKLYAIITFFTMIFSLSLWKLSLSFKAREHFESMVRIFLMLNGLIAVAITVLTVAMLFVEALKFFKVIPPLDFITGITWNPQIEGTIEEIQGNFGALALIAGTLLITVIAICFAVPVGLMSAIYLTQYAHAKLRNILKPILELLAGIPTIVYGYFAAITISPMIRHIGTYFHLHVSSENALSAGIVMGIMVLPFIVSISDDIINSVPGTLKDASLALGATQAETTIKVILPAAIPGIMGAILLAISRCIGETMIVTMAAGLTANFTANPLDSVTAVTAQIVSLLTGDQEFDNPRTLAAFALALLLFAVTLGLNIIANLIVYRYKKR